MPRTIRPVSHGARVLAAALAMSLPACVDLDLDGLLDVCDGPCPSPPPQDCARLRTTSWSIWTPENPSEIEMRVAVGESRGVSLSPFVEAHCVAGIASVTWSAGDAPSAEVTAKPLPHRGAWLTGLQPGPGTIRARIVFVDGPEQQAAKAFVVVPTREPSGSVVAEGAIPLDRAPEWTRFIPFELPAGAGRLDITVDWSSVSNHGDVFLYRGACAGNSVCAGLDFIPLPSVQERKPVFKGATNLAAGTYSIRVDNLGPGADVLRYEVRATPR